MGMCKLLIMRSKGTFLSFYFFNWLRGVGGISEENGGLPGVLWSLPTGKAEKAARERGKN